MYQGMSKLGENTLTDREKDVFMLVGEGRTNHEIAAALRISVWTVANHRKHICAKLGVHSTAGLVALARGARGQAAPIPMAGRRDGAVDCVLKLNLPQPQGGLKLTYRGRLRKTPGVAEVRIGRKVYFF